MRCVLRDLPDSRALPDKSRLQKTQPRDPSPAAQDDSDWHVAMYKLQRQAGSLCHLKTLRSCYLLVITGLPKIDSLYLKGAAVTALATRPQSCARVMPATTLAARRRAPLLTSACVARRCPCIAPGCGEDWRCCAPGTDWAECRGSPPTSCPAAPRPCWKNPAAGR